MTGTTPRCAYCGRPVINAPTVYGAAGEAYHVECTHPGPRQQSMQYQAGCVCPPTSEQTCQASLCPRRGLSVTAMR
jgi:hypothetical protein